MSLPEAQSPSQLKQLYEDRRTTVTFGREVRLIENCLKQLESLPATNTKEEQQLVQSFLSELLYRRKLILNNRMN